MYAAWNGPRWTNSTGWVTDAHVCDWFGVQCCVASAQQASQCTGDQRGVISLRLPRNGLNGSLAAVRWATLAPSLQ
jgi:hypothetical protein